MGMIDRYIYAVTRRLPQSQREDINKELQGLIEDMLTERCGGEEPEKADIEAVLKKLGEPSQLAGKYRDTKQYLIGPEFFDLYMLVLRIVLAVTIGGVALGKTIALFVDTPANAAQGLGELAGSIISAVFSAFAWVTIVFAVTERLRLKKNEKVWSREWNPEELPEIPSKKAIIKRSEPIAGIIFAVLFIILFNFANQLIGFYHMEGGKLIRVIPVFSEEGLKQFIVFVLGIFCISILKECIKLIVGKWTLTLGIVNTVLNLVVLGLSILVFTNPAIWNVDFVKELVSAGMPSADVSIVTTVWDRTTNGFIYVVALICLIDSAASLWKSIHYKLS